MSSARLSLGLEDVVYYSEDVEYTLVLEIETDEGSKAQLKIPECDAKGFFPSLQRLASEYRCALYPGNYYPNLRIDFRVFPYGLILVGLTLPEAELAPLKPEILQEKRKLQGLLEDVRGRLQEFSEWDESDWSLPGANLPNLLKSFTVSGPPMGLTGLVVFKPPSVGFYIKPTHFVEALEEFATVLEPHLEELDDGGTKIQREIREALEFLWSGLLGKTRFPKDPDKSRGRLPKKE